MKNQVRVLLYDLEVSPLLGWAYKIWDTNILKIERQSYIFCFSYMWLGDKDVKCISQIDFPARYKSDPYDDYDVVKALWSLINEADIVVAHNAKGFDDKVSMGRFLVHNLTPPSPFKAVDTLTVARSKFKFASNKLGDICTQLGIGAKSEETHSDLWYDCIQGDRQAWKKMVQYCKQDTKLLHSLYVKVLPYITNHPSLTLISQDLDACPRCGSGKLHHRGIRGVYQRFQCMDCHSWLKERIADNYEAQRPMYVNDN